MRKAIVFFAAVMLVGYTVGCSTKPKKKGPKGSPELKVIVQGVEVEAGKEAKMAVEVIRKYIDGDIAVMIEGAPDGVTLNPANFEIKADQVAPTEVKVKAEKTAKAGQYDLVVNAEGGGKKASAKVKLTIKAATKPEPKKPEPKKPDEKEAALKKWQTDWSKKVDDALAKAKVKDLVSKLDKAIKDEKDDKKKKALAKAKDDLLAAEKALAGRRDAIGKATKDSDLKKLGAEVQSAIDALNAQVTAAQKALQPAPTPPKKDDGKKKGDGKKKDDGKKKS